MKKIVFIVLVCTILSFIPEKIVNAAELYSGIDEKEYALIDEYIKSDSMVGRIEWTLQNKINVSDIDSKKAIKVNILPRNFIDLYWQHSNINEIYGDQWQYKIPMLIDGKKLVITLNINKDGSFEYVGMSYGDGNEVFFLDNDAIYNELNSKGIMEKDIEYYDILYAYDINTLFVHFNICKESKFETLSSNDNSDYMLPFSTTDFADEYMGPQNLKYENGVIKSDTDILLYLKYSSYYAEDIEFDGNLNGSDVGISNVDNKAVMPKDIQETDRKREQIEYIVSKEEYASNKMLIGGALLLVTTLLVIIGYNKFRHQ